MERYCVITLKVCAVGVRGELELQTVVDLVWALSYCIMQRYCVITVTLKVCVVDVGGVLE